MSHREEYRPLWRAVKITMPASREGLKLMSKAGWWVNADGSVSKRRNRSSKRGG